MNFNEEDTREFYKWLGHKPDEYTEIRIIPWPTGPIIQRWVQKEEDFVKICKKFSGKNQVYAGINPRKRESGSTEDIARVTAIFFDIDSKHPKNEPANDTELEKAKKRVIEINSWISMKGFKQPLIDMSGNGFHLGEKVDIPITDDLPQKLEAYFHEAPTEGFDSIFDLPRIIKVPGTMSIKGNATKERPHRLSYIINLGDDEPDEKLAKHILELEPYKPIIAPIIEKEKKRKTSKLRPCFKRFAEEGGVLSEIRSEDHLLRLALVHEAHTNGYNRNQIIKLFEKAEDWNLKKTQKAVNDELKVIMKRGARPWRCIKIYNRKGCLGETCPIYKKQMAKHIPKEPLEPDDPLRFCAIDEKGNMIKFYTKIFCEMLQKDYKFIATSAKSVVWIYNPKKGIWEKNGTELIQEEVAKRLEIFYKKIYVNEVISYIRYTNYINPKLIGGPPNKIVMKNGVFNIDTETLTPFDPTLYEINSIPVNYDPNANCPQINKFIKEVLKPEDIDKINEIIGYCIYKKYPIARIFVFSGEGHNGKTQLINIISNFLGKENVTSLTLQEIADDRFAKAQLYGKIANLAADIPATPIKHSGIIKALTGGDKISAQHKFLDRFEFTNHSKLIFSANEVPKTYDNTTAFFRRMITVPFTKIFLAGAPGTILDIGNKISTPEELSGLFNIAIISLKRLLKNGKFTNEGTVEERKEQWIKDSNPAQYFINKFVEEASTVTYYIKKGVLYKKYTQLCHALKKRPIASNKFSIEITRYLPYIDDGEEYEVIGQKKDGTDRLKKYRVWYGIVIKNNDLEKEMISLGTVATITTINSTPVKLQNYNKKENNKKENNIELDWSIKHRGNRVNRSKKTFGDIKKDLKHHFHKKTFNKENVTTKTVELGVARDIASDFFEDEIKPTLVHIGKGYYTWP